MKEREGLYYCKLKSLPVLLDLLAELKRGQIKLVVNRAPTNYESWKMEIV